jgi:hypothetical protein
MMGDADVFVELDRRVSGIIKFGDGSYVDIQGRGTVFFTMAGGQHRVLTHVYWIPRLRSNVISIGQLDEIGCPAHIENGVMMVRDSSRRVIVSVTWACNRLYPARLAIVKPVCLLVHAGDAAWLWHARFRHQHFQGLERLASQEMVHGMPRITHPEQLYDACLPGKQRRMPFPQVAKFRATTPLQLVHGDLCGPISSATQGG